MEESRSHPPDGLSADRADYRHINRLLLIIIVILALALIVRQLVVPEMRPSEFGAFRVAAIGEAMQLSARHVGAAACLDCHEDVIDLHAKDLHTHVSCETCHGPGDRHAADPTAENIRIERGAEACLVCHRALDARPGSFPQITRVEHFSLVGVADQNTDCTACHSPHEPLYLDRDIRSARLHPLIQRCEDCHIGRGDRTLERPQGHPEIFECAYCHGAIVEDAAARPHMNIECTTCHIFVKENEFSGRIIRDSDPRFCLLCHGEATFRGPDSPPSIGWPAHRDDVAIEPGDRDKRCIDCHLDRIHQFAGAER